MNNTKNWDKRFLNLAYNISTWSTCLGLEVGAVLVRDKRILTTGYNGAPSGCPHCTDQGFCYEGVNNCSESNEPSRAIHAEINAIGQAAKYGIATEGTTLYITHEPCLNCLKAGIAAGIKEIVYWSPFNSENKKPIIDLFVKQTGIILRCYTV